MQHEQTPHDCEVIAIAFRLRLRDQLPERLLDRRDLLRREDPPLSPLLARPVDQRDPADGDVQELGDVAGVEEPVLDRFGSTGSRRGKRRGRWVVEIVPVIGPLSAGALAIGVGFTDSWHTAFAAGLCVLGVRLVEDYVVVPRVLGDAAASLKASAAEKAQERQHDDDKDDEHDEEKTRLLSTRQVAGGLRQS